MRELKQRGCPTCGCTLYSENGDLERDTIRDAERWRKLRIQGGWPDTEASMSGASPEDFDRMIDGLDG